MQPAPRQHDQPLTRHSNELPEHSQRLWGGLLPPEVSSREAPVLITSSRDVAQIRAFIERPVKRNGKRPRLFHQFARCVPSVYPRIGL